MLLLKCCVRKVDQVLFASEGTLYTAGKRMGYEYIAIADNCGVEVWHPTQSRERLNHIFPDNQIDGMFFIPNTGQIVVNLCWTITEQGKLGIGWYDLATEKIGRYERSNPREAVIAAVQNLVVSRGDFTQNRLAGWHNSELEAAATWEVSLIDIGHLIVRAAITEDDSRLVCYETRGGNMMFEQTHTLVERTCSDGSVIQNVQIPRRKLTTLSFSPDSRWIAAACGNVVLVWDSANFKTTPIALADSGRLDVTGLAFHPGGNFLAATSNDSMVRLYDTDTWRCVKTFSWDIGRLRSVAFSADGLLAAAGSDSGRVVVWDVEL
jgi:WD40 repeat protein